MFWKVAYIEAWSWHKKYNLHKQYFLTLYIFIFFSFNQKHSKSTNIVKYYYNLKYICNAK